MNLRTNRPVCMIPCVVDAAGDERAKPGFGEQVVDIGLAEAGGDAGEEFLLEAVVEAAQRVGENVGFTSAFVANDL